MGQIPWRLHDFGRVCALAYGFWYLGIMVLTSLCHNLGSVWKVPQTSVLFAEVSRKF